MPPKKRDPTKLEERTFDADAVDDLVLLSSVSEASICKNLETRFQRDDIYTYIGPVLLSVNPFKNMGPLYSTPLSLKYNGRYMYELAPHVYAVAEDAYRAMRAMKIDQCILVSGESGAGKTEAAKKIMEYVALVSDRGSTASDIRERLLRSNPVLEAFGNAKTVRNDNSSRFGKYMELLFNPAGVPVGGRITNYLLERPRVVNASPAERSFHIFYQLLTDASWCAEWEMKGTKPADYTILAGREMTVAGLDDAKEYTLLRKAMAEVGLSTQKALEQLSAVAAIMKLGNLTFGSSTVASGAVLRRESSRQLVSGGSGGELAGVARLLSVEPAALEKCLTFRTVTSERIATPLRDSECVETRDATCKALYARLFDALVATLNEAVATSAGTLTMGVLDIYGFEIFEVNSFEQLCINYCNEKLQQLFIELTLKAEQEEYAAEGIAWTPVEYFDNRIVCDLIEAKKPAGVLAYLDEESQFPQATDTTLYKKLVDQLSKHSHFVGAASSSTFTIKHYAGDVSYSPLGMLDKNRDTLYRDVTQTMGTSSSRFIASLFPGAAGGSKAGAAIGKRQVTAGAQFREQMVALVDQLTTCAPHYIRTIKPNDQKRSGAFDLPRVQHQVRYLGLLENVRVRRAGFAHRETYVRFAARYKLLCAATWPEGSGDERADSRTILDAMGLTADAQFGRTKVFLKEPNSLFALENAREAALPGVVVIVQKRWQGILARERFVVLRFAVKTQRAWKAYRARCALIELRNKAIAIFDGNKRRGISVSLYPLGDYLNATDNTDLTAPLNKYGDSSNILFADGVQYFSKTELKAKSAFSPHILIVTHKCLHVLLPPLANAPTKEKEPGYKLVRTLPLDRLTGLALSTFADGYVVCQVAEAGEGASKEDKKLAAEGDVVFESGRKAEIVQIVKGLPRKGELKLTFSDTLEFTSKNNDLVFGGMKSPKKKSIDFSETNSLGGRQSAITMPTKANMLPKRKMVVNIPPSLGTQAPLQIAKHQAASQAKNSRKSERAAPKPPPSRPDEPATAQRARVLYDFAGQEAGDLPLKAGDVVEVLDRSGEWWKGKQMRGEGKTGTFPSNYVKLIEIQGVGSRYSADM